MWLNKKFQNGWLQEHSLHKLSQKVKIKFLRKEIQKRSHLMHSAEKNNVKTA
jgi:hypothetical protein